MKTARRLDGGVWRRSEDQVYSLLSKAQAARVSQFTAFFYVGRLEEFGPTRQLFAKPAKARTEDYITGRFG